MDNRYSYQNNSGRDSTWREQQAQSRPNGGNDSHALGRWQADGTFNMAGPGDLGISLNSGLLGLGPGLLDAAGFPLPPPSSYPNTFHTGPPPLGTVQLYGVGSAATGSVHLSKPSSAPSPPSFASSLSSAPWPPTHTGQLGGEGLTIQGGGGGGGGHDSRTHEQAHSSRGHGAEGGFSMRGAAGTGSPGWRNSGGGRVGERYRWGGSRGGESVGEGYYDPPLPPSPPPFAYDGGVGGGVNSPHPGPAGWPHSRNSHTGSGRPSPPSPQGGHMGHAPMNDRSFVESVASASATNQPMPRETIEYLSSHPLALRCMYATLHVLLRDQGGCRLLQSRLQAGEGAGLVQALMRAVLPPGSPRTWPLPPSSAGEAATPEWWDAGPQRLEDVLGLPRHPDLDYRSEGQGVGSGPGGAASIAASPVARQIYAWRGRQHALAVCQLPFANYVLQKMAQLAHPSAALVLLKGLLFGDGAVIGTASSPRGTPTPPFASSFEIAATHINSTRVLQRLMEGVCRDGPGPGMDLVLAELLQGFSPSSLSHGGSTLSACVFTRLCTDGTGNHVVCAILNMLRETALVRLLRAVAAEASRLAASKFGCIVVQRALTILASNSTSAASAPMLAETDREGVYAILLHSLAPEPSHTLRMCCDPCGNFAMQCLLATGGAAERKAILSHACGSVLLLATHKFASNVAEILFAAAFCDPRPRSSGLIPAALLSPTASMGMAHSLGPGAPAPGSNGGSSAASWAHLRFSSTRGTAEDWEALPVLGVRLLRELTCQDATAPVSGLWPPGASALSSGGARGPHTPPFQGVTPLPWTRAMPSPYPSTSPQPHLLSILTGHAFGNFALISAILHIPVVLQGVGEGARQGGNSICTGHKRTGDGDGGDAHDLHSHLAYLLADSPWLTLLSALYPCFTLLRQAALPVNNAAAAARRIALRLAGRCLEVESALGPSVWAAVPSGGRDSECAEVAESDPSEYATNGQRIPVWRSILRVAALGDLLPEMAVWPQDAISTGQDRRL